MKQRAATSSTSRSAGYSRPADCAQSTEGGEDHIDDAGRARLGHDLLIAFGLAAGPAVALGFARFAYALLLPSMQSSLRWSFFTAGAMNTANAAGYLVGALCAAPLSHRVGPRPVFLGTLVLTGLLLLASAATGNVAVLLVLRALAGASGAATFIVGGALAAQLGQGSIRSRPALMLGIYFGGGGLGIAVSAFVLPQLLAVSSPTTGWRWGWVALAAATAVAVAAATPALIHAPTPAPNADRDRFPLRTILGVLAAYTAFGAGYIAYMTFIIAYLKSGGAGTTEVTAFWAVLGIAAVAGGFLWGPVLSRLHGGRGPALLMAVVAVGALLPLVTTAPPAAFGSAVLFGVSFLAVVTAVTNAARNVLRPEQWTAAIATLTTGFALGQCLGPILSGVLADQANGVEAGLFLSVIILLIGAGISLLQRARPAPAVSSTSPNR